MKSKEFIIEDRSLKAEVKKLVVFLGLAYIPLVYYFNKNGRDGLLVLSMFGIPFFIFILIYYNRELYRTTKIGLKGIEIVDLELRKTIRVSWDEVDYLDYKLKSEDQASIKLKTDTYLPGFYRDGDFQKRFVKDTPKNYEDRKAFLEAYDKLSEEKSYREAKKSYESGSYEKKAKDFKKHKDYLDRLGVPEELRSDKRLRARFYKNMPVPLKIKRRLSIPRLIVYGLIFFWIFNGFIELSLGLIFVEEVPQTPKLYIVNFMFFITLLIFAIDFILKLRPCAIYPRRIKIRNNILPFLSKTINREDVGSVACFYYENGCYKLKDHVEIELRDGEIIRFENIDDRNYSYLDCYLYLDDFLNKRL